MKAGILPRLWAFCRSTSRPRRPTPRTGSARPCAGTTPNFPGRAICPRTLATLRGRDDDEPGRKVLIVIDQFEQWLHAHPDDHDGELIRALRQCDGRRVQCVLLVRDDFWMAITGFLHDVEVKLVEGENSAG